MEQWQFEDMVARLERESQAWPTAYRAKVALLAAAGFGILGIIVGSATFGLAALVGLAVAAVLTGGKALLVVFKLGKVVLLLAVPFWLLVRASVSALFTRLPVPGGLELQRAQVPALFDALDKMRRRMKGPRFHHVLIVDDLNAAVVQRPLFGLVGWPRNYLLLGLPLLEALAPKEALAVVAHEYGHLACSHGRFGAFIYRLRRTWRGVGEVAQEWQGWAARPLQRVVGWYAPYFDAYTFVLARANEYEADAAAAGLVGAGVAASALKRVDIAAAHYAAFTDRIFSSVRDLAKPPADMTTQWAACALQAPPAAQARLWLAAALNRVPDVGDTHPVLRERLHALPGQAGASAQVPEPLQAESAATRLLGKRAAIVRDHVQREWQSGVRANWAERHGELQAQLQRLRDLEARASPGVQEGVERMRLLASVYPEVDHLDALAAFNAAHANQPVTLYLEACARLDRDDGAGLRLLERTIALDPAATKPACERAYAFLEALGDDRAAAWADRWKKFHELEQAA